MNWKALLQLILKVFEDNPQLAQTLIVGLLTILTNDPAILKQAVTTGLALAQASTQNSVTKVS